jgi:hypothetical protein
MYARVPAALTTMSCAKLAGSGTTVSRVLVAASMTSITVGRALFTTSTRCESGVTARARGFGLTGMVEITALVARSRTAIVPAAWLVTYARAPLGATATSRG